MWCAGEGVWCAGKGVWSYGLCFCGRNYLDTILDLPWSKSTTDQLSIAKARECLDSEHYGLDKLKKRVVEYLAVRQLKNDLKGREAN